MLKLSILLYLTVISLTSTTTQITQQTKPPQPCFCNNQGQCIQDTNNQPTCNCLLDFIGTTCQQPATPIFQQMPQQNITNQFAYYYYTFINRSTYYMKLNFSSTTPQQNIFLIQIKLQVDPNEQLLDEQLYKQTKFLAHRQFYKTIQGILILNKYFTEGISSLKIIFRIKTLKDNLTSGINEVGRINITSEFTNLMIYGQQEMYYFVMFSSMLTFILFVFTYITCVWIIKIRLRRHQFRATMAEPFNNIGHFDQSFPAILYQNLQNRNQENNQCMICLLPLSQTLVRITPCLHYFHQECIDRWGIRSLTCPTCRNSLAPSSSQNQNPSIIQSELRPMDELA